MFLDYALHPKLNTIYQFPRRQADLTSPNARRNTIFTVPGGGGPINPKGAAALDREPNVITYQFQINPISDRVSVDAQRDAFMVACDHGLPQMLAFQTDTGAHWFAQCVLTANAHHQTASSDASHIIEASWQMLTDHLQLPATPGTAVYGRYFKYGHPPDAIQDSNGHWSGGTADGTHSQFGAKADKFTLAAGNNVFSLDNTMARTGATAATTDAIFTLTGPFGSTDPAHFPILVYCQESLTGFAIYKALAAYDYFTVDLASRRVLFDPAGAVLPQPAFQNITKVWANANWLSILPDQVNSFVVGFGQGAVPIAVGPTTLATLQWRPKRSM